MVRVGLVGFGFIGAGLYRSIHAGEYKGLEIAFVWNRSPDKLADVPPELVLNDPGRLRRGGQARIIIVEASHPGPHAVPTAKRFSKPMADYMPLSGHRAGRRRIARAHDRCRNGQWSPSDHCRRARWWEPTRCLAGVTCGATSRSRFANIPTISISARSNGARRTFVGRPRSSTGRCARLRRCFPATSIRW